MSDAQENAPPRDVLGGPIPGEGPLLGIDYGTVRVGVAAAMIFDIVHPAGFVDAEPREAMLRRIKAMAEDRQCVGLVVGLPYNMDGSEGPSAAAARKLGADLHRVVGLPVAFHDERLTSDEAQKKIGEMGLTRKKRKARVDAVAAMGILQGYLAERADRLRRRAPGADGT